MEVNRWDLLSLIIEFEFTHILKDQGSRSTGLSSELGESQSAGSEATGGGRGCRGCRTLLTLESSYCQLGQAALPPFLLHTGLLMAADTFAIAHGASLLFNG